jgi:hypothetical protein
MISPEELIKYLESTRQKHSECEDSWYSCPESEDGCSNDSEVDCNCGADDFNKQLDDIIFRVKMIG